jgi:pilin isopeptide linkage protein
MLADKLVHYVVTATTPSENTLTSQNVVVTDEFRSGDEFIELLEIDKKNDVYATYRNVTITDGSGTKLDPSAFDVQTGVWTIGDMEPGTTLKLEYDVKLKKDFYTGSGDDIENRVTATYNENGRATDEDTQDASGTVIINKNPGDASGSKKTLQTDENGESYLVYTVTVTAYNGDVTDVSVLDTFTQNASAVARYEYDNPSVGSVTTTDKSGSTNASLTWTVGSLKEGDSATLTYRAYLDADVWNILSNKATNDTEVVRTILDLVNTATAMIDDTPVDKDTTKSTIEKVFAKKSAQTVKNSTQINYTVAVNSYPSTDKITSITDTITEGSVTYGDTITLRRYEYTSDGTRTYTDYTISSSDVKTSESSFTIDLTSVNGEDLSGPYYYEVRYSVDAGTSLSVKNQAGMGVGINGKNYTYTHSISTKNAGASFTTNKTVWDADMDNGTLSFKITLSSTSANGDTLPAGSVYYDELWDGRKEYWWFTADEVAETKVMLGDTDITDKTTIVPGGKYIDGQANNGTETGGYPSGQYIGFKVVFNEAVYNITSSNPVTIIYKVHYNQFAKEKNGSQKNGNEGYMHNKGKWSINGGTLTTGDSSGNYTINNVSYWPIFKTGTYNAESDESKGTKADTITWSIEANRGGNISGDAVITDTIPAGQTLVLYDGADADSLSEEELLKKSVSLTLNTYNKVTSTGEIDKVEVEWPDDPDTEATVVKIYLKNLTGYVYNNYRNADGTLNSTGIAMLKDSSWVNYGWVTLTLTTELTDQAKMAQNTNTEAKNTAMINGGVLKKDYYTSTATVKPGVGTLTKAMASQEFPAYVQFVLDINKDAINLDADKDEVTVYDTMGTRLTLAPEHTDYLKVYDMSNASDDDVTNGTLLSDDQYTVELGEDGNSFQITVPDQKYIKVVYWAKFEGSAGESYDLTNTAEYYYENHLVHNDGSEWSNKLSVQFSDVSAMSNPTINVYKVDQSGDPLAGVTFTLYKVTKNADGTVTRGDQVAEKTTGMNGTIYFGHRDNDAVKYKLERDVLYCIVETNAPAGYSLSDPYYFEFPDIYDLVDNQYVVNADKEAAHLAAHPTEVTVNDKLPSETVTVVDTLSVPSLTIPLNKLINGKNTESGVDFTFTLKQVAGGTAYTDDNTAEELINNGITVTNDGSGTVEFATLYFPTDSTYTFTLAEEDTTANGFTKDATVYKIDVDVTLDKVTNQLSVVSAKYSTGNIDDGYTEQGNILTAGNVPTFDNTFSLTGTFELTLHKAITNWASDADMPAFNFEVYRNNLKIAEGTNGTDGAITINVPITQDDLGTDQRFVIKEVKQEGTSFTYDTDSVVVAADIGLDDDGNLAASNIAYKTKEGTFTNVYNAKGSLTLEGTKYLYLDGDDDTEQAIRAGQFNFVVKEGDTTVATGTTEKGGAIDFTTIRYVATDIGTHTYVISEKKGHELFQTYDAPDVTVTVVVADDSENPGQGNLTATITSVQIGDEDSDDQSISFTNTCTYIVPTGINLDVVPYVLIIAIALCGCGAVIATNRRRRRHSN